MCFGGLLSLGYWFRVFCIGLRDAVGSCPSLVLVWSFPLFARPLPVGYSRNSWHKGRQYGVNTKERGSYWMGVLRAAFRILSPKWVFPQNS